jgi:nucleotidyltransferase substrate binding protein (TIGR01987 family)
VPINTEHLKRCLETLENSIILIHKAEKGGIDYEIFRNAVVKGYELTLEVSGKLLRRAIKPFFANPREVDSLSFKDLFRHGAKHGILTAEEVERWFKYRDNRNTTAHDYGEGFAEETLVLMPDFILDVKRLLERLDNAGD